MCGINGIYMLSHDCCKNLGEKIYIMNKILKHRGPDDDKIWVNNANYIGFGHTRLSIIDLNNHASQPMIRENYVLVFNGEIYNFMEIKEKIKSQWTFTTKSDTEIILALYHVYGEECVNYMNGMFSFVVWDNNTNKLFCARDRLGIKPFYYMIQDDIFYFASETKAIIPFLDEIQEDINGIGEYLTFQFTLGDNTMIKNIKQLLPAHTLSINNKEININKYWQINYSLKTNKNEQECIEHIKTLFDKSMDLHIRSDVPVSSYASGGIDSTIVATLTAKKIQLSNIFHGKFDKYPECDESQYANILANNINIELKTLNITSNDFVENIEKLTYHLDYPVAGPGSFPQFVLSKYVSKYVKVILGGQGGDEIFCGYARYLIPYIEKSLIDAINGMPNNLINIAPHIKLLQNYKPMIKKYFKNAFSDAFVDKYFELINRTSDFENVVNWNVINKDKIYSTFVEKFNEKNIPENDFFNYMLNFDLKYSLPALLHVEDRVSMAWGLESRVPIVNHEIIEFVASIPEEIKIGSEMKYLLKKTFNDVIPEKIMNREDKMGFPVPLNDWFNNDLKQLFTKHINSLKQRNLSYLNIDDNYIQEIYKCTTFSRTHWILLSLELWYQTFFDNFYQLKFV